MPRIDQMTPDVALWNGGFRYRENILGRGAALSNSTTALTTAVMTCIGVPLYAGDLVSKVTVVVGATAGATITNQWAALYTPGGVLMTGSQSPDGLSAAIPATAPLTFSLTVPQLIQTEGIYYAAVMVKATTVPSLAAQTGGVTGASDAVLTGMAVRCQTSGSALSTTAPATIASPSTVGFTPYVVLS